MVDINALTSFTEKTMKALQDALANGDGVAVKKYDELLQKASAMGKAEVSKMKPPAKKTGEDPNWDHAADDGYYNNQFKTAKAGPMPPQVAPSAAAGGMEMPTDFQMDIPTIPLKPGNIPEGGPAPDTSKWAPTQKEEDQRWRDKIAGKDPGKKPGTAPMPMNFLDLFLEKTPDDTGKRSLALKTRDPRGQDLLKAGLVKGLPPVDNAPAPLPTEDELEADRKGKATSANDYRMSERSKADAEELAGMKDQPEGAQNALFKTLGAVRMNAEDVREATVLENIEKKYKSKPSAFTWENLAIMLLMGAPRAYAKYLDETKTYDDNYAKEYDRYDAKKEREAVRADTNRNKAEYLKIQELLAGARASESDKKFGLERFKQDRTDRRADQRNKQSFMNTVAGSASKLQDSDGQQRMIDVINHYEQQRKAGEQPEFDLEQMVSQMSPDELEQFKQLILKGK